MLYKGIHAPGPRAATDTAHEIVQHLAALCRVEHLRVELDRINLTGCIFRRCHRAVRRVGNNPKARCGLTDIIKMTHPADGCIGIGFVIYAGFSRGLASHGCAHTCKKRRGPIYEHLCFSIFTNRCLFYLSTKNMIHQLRTVAQTQNRNPQLK